MRLFELGEVEDLDRVMLRRNDSSKVRGDRRRRKGDMEEVFISNRVGCLI